MAANISTLRPLIQAALKTQADRVFYERTTGNPTFPYVVYSLNGFKYEDVIDQAELEVNCYDNTPDTATLETLADNIAALFDHKYYIDSNIEYHAYNNIRNNIDTGDPKIHQRRLLITLRTL